MLIVRNLTYKRGSKTILDNLSCEFKPGTITCIVGPSGAGKSTLLSCIAQLYTNYTGTVSIEDTNLQTLTIAQRTQLVGMVFQQFNLFPQLTARDNIAQPLWVTGMLSKELAYANADKLLATFGMQDYANRYISQLSGGQQQRVALARALGLQPKVLCLDEPTSALDKENTLLLVEELKRLKQEGITLVITSHDTFLVDACADTVLELTEGLLKKID